MWIQSCEPHFLQFMQAIFPPPPKKNLKLNEERKPPHKQATYLNELQFRGKIFCLACARGCYTVIILGIRADIPG